MISCFKGKFRVTSPYGNRILGGKTEFHKGLDLVGESDTTVYAVSGGKVRTAFQANGAGNYAVVTQDDGKRIYYMHLKKFLVKNSAVVSVGEPIGIMGNTGNSFGAHTHLEIRPKGTSSESLDISEYTGIPNKTGTYFYDPAENSEEEIMTDEQFDKLMESYLSRKSSLPASEWSENARKYCESRGIVKGDGLGSFGYRSFVTREEAAEIAYRIISGLTGERQD